MNNTTTIPTYQIIFHNFSTALYLTPKIPKNYHNPVFALQFEQGASVTSQFANSQIDRSIPIESMQMQIETMQTRYLHV